MSTLDLARPSLIKTFSRSQVASFVATMADFGLLFSLVEFFGVWYVLATALGTLTGGVTNFLLNRHWSFQAGHRKWHGQALRYTLISGTSMILNTGGVYLVTEYGHIHYSISVIVVSIVIGVFFNFPFQRHFVFK
ncbi:MAG TPA: GtrA family protein [Bdellovibrionota bacterium]|nr:GtrA family protein [Bdellovibrionota bacterium]